MQSNWWFVPELLNDELTDLVLPPNKVLEGSQELKKASPLTVYLHSVYIATSKDPSGLWKNREGNSNDLFITSIHKTGSSPKVQRIHYYKEREPINKLYSNFFDSVIFSTNDFTYERILVNIQIFDIDSYDKYRDILTTISGMSNSAATSFPALSPYTAYAALAIPGVNGILNLVDTLNEHDPILNDSLRLEITTPMTGSTILQTGNFVYFNLPQEDGLKMNSMKNIIENDGKIFSGCDYAVISVQNKEIAEINEWEKDQKAAKLMSELQGKGSSGKAGIEFLRDTMDGYSNFKKLQRILELEGKKKAGQQITTEEETILKKYTKDPNLIPFLPKE